MDAFWIIVFVAILIIILSCCKGKRGKPMFSAPVVVTTTTQQMPFTPGPQMQQTNVYPFSNQTAYPSAAPFASAAPYASATPYPTGQQGFGMPMPAVNQQSYPTPQAGYAAFPVDGYPPGGQANMNPPSYDQVVGTTTTITTDTHAKQAPYNPNYTG